jgi:RHS repeat-associated protein
VVKAGVTYRLITDHLGSPRIIVNTATGSIVGRADYDEYGNVTSSYDSLGLPFGFAGGLYDSQTKLVRFGARDYQSDIGRWTTKDPAGFAGKDANQYEYVDQDPINWKDPQGCWKAAEHTSLTTKALEGFDEDAIAAAVAGNLYVDRFTNQLSNAEHAMPETWGGYSAIKSVQDSYLAAAIVSAFIGQVLGGDNLMAMGFLGQGLHCVQDQFSHWERGYFFGSWPAHLTPKPDDPKDEASLKSAAIASDKYVKRFLQGKY